MARVPKKVVRTLEVLLWNAKAIHTYLRMDKVVICHKGDDGILREMPKDEYASALFAMRGALDALITKYKRENVE